MTLPVVDILVSVFFLGALAVSIRFYLRAQTQDKEGQLHLVLGLSVLSAVALFELAGSFHLLSGISALSEPLLVQLITWVGMISGIVFVALGVARKLSTPGQANSAQHGMTNRNEMLKHIAQLIQVEKKASQLLQKSLQTLASDYTCSHAALFVRTKSGEMTFLQAIGEAMHTEAAYRSFVFEVQPDQVELLDVASASFESQVVEEVAKPEAVVPVITESGAVAVFLLWNQPDVVWSSEDLQTMKLAAGLIAQRIDGERIRLKESFYLTRDNWRSTTETILVKNEALREQLPVLLSHIQSQLPADLLSIGILSPQQLLRRISISPASGVLDEHRINLYRRPSHLSAVLEKHQGVLVHDVARDYGSSADDFLKRNAIQSFIAVPLFQQEGIKSVLTVAAHAAGSYSRKHVGMIEAIVPIIRELVQRELWKEVDGQNRSRLLVVSELLQTVASNRSVHEIIEQVGQTLARLMNTSIVRISMLETDGISLRSRYLTCSHATHVSTPADGHMILSVLPQHAGLISSESRSVPYLLVNNEAISESEAVLVFAPAVKQMLLVPIRANGNAVGVIGCADMRPDNRSSYSQEDIALVQAMAGVIGTVIHRIMAADMLYSQIGAPKQERPKADSVDLVRPAVRSSLSGIVGSLEMLQGSQAAQDEQVQRYLSIIDRSTRRMSRIFDTELVSEPTE